MQTKQRKENGDKPEPFVDSAYPHAAGSSEACTCCYQPRTRPGIRTVGFETPLSQSGTYMGSNHISTIKRRAQSDSNAPATQFSSSPPCNTFVGAIQLSPLSRRSSLPSTFSPSQSYRWFGQSISGITERAAILSFHPTSGT
ncbi:uncharacterized protein FIBRA_08031 [Fibroporia radiculosa]|uniref:Uncharacterized protein n=1 Tax=Fibroporia radiculosa TaxID=599839 RepID=J4I1Y9_9APHY|nr:uncharacterized protein FIBRA_08031 [Fibroporia radiculosa]CCM05797.1 predicted protein [Fibroporia radiculosa]